MRERTDYERAKVMERLARCSAYISTDFDPEDVKETYMKMAILGRNFDINDKDFSRGAQNGKAEDQADPGTGIHGEKTKKNLARDFVAFSDTHAFNSSAKEIGLEGRRAACRIA